MARALVGAGGMALLVLGAVLEFSVNTQTSASALADSAPYELYCPGTPLGNVVLNNVTTSATISPAAPTPGQQFTLSGYQTDASLPSSLVAAVAALQPDLEGSATAQIDVTGATPAISVVGPLKFDVPVPTPVPDGGLNVTLSSSSGSAGPFTAMSSDIAIQEDGRVGLMLKVSGNSVDLTCAAYPNDSITPSGVTTSPPAASPIAPVIVTAGSPTTTSDPSNTVPGATTTTPDTSTNSPPPSILTGAYELYCPGSPLGNVALNDVVTSADLSPSAPTAGQSFSLANYQITLDLPSSLAGAAAALEPDIMGSATTQIYGTGAAPATTVQGPLDFAVPIVAPVPDTGVVVSLPANPATISGFIATSATVTIQQESAASISLTLGGNAVALACTAYPNNSVTPSGITSLAPTTSPIAPVIAMGGSITATPVTTLIPTPPATTPIATSTTAPPATITPPTLTTAPPAPSPPTTTAPETTTPPAAPAPSPPTTTAPVTIVPTTLSPAGLNPTSTSTTPPILIGPGPQTTYAVQAQPAPGTCHYRYAGSDPLPDPTCTPGAINPRVNQGDIGTTICKAGYTDTIRPPESVTEKEKTASAAAYGYTGSLQTAEYDHLIPLELGGDPNDPSNLWVEPNDKPNATSTSNTKDTLENVLNGLVCSGRITLAQAQEAIATNWVTALQTYGGLPAGTTTTVTPSTTSAPVPSTSSSSSSGIAVAGTSGATGASSSVPTTAVPPALASTGPGHGLKTMTLVGASTMFLGLLMLVLADLPRRALRRLASHGSHGYKDRATRRSLAMPKSVREDVAWGSGWLLGR